jgi:hypothetical protein
VIARAALCLIALDGFRSKKGGEPRTRGGRKGEEKDKKGISSARREKGGDKHREEGDGEESKD